MCRFLAYRGEPIILYDVLFKPVNSLIKQSFKALETEEPLNGDGFGIAWYSRHIDDMPALFKSIQPAWNDQNLRHLTRKIQSDCFLAHVRAASFGAVSVNNTHPFNYEQITFMHNGDIGQFEVIRRELRSRLSDEVYNWIQGQTDSEHFFALFIERLKQSGKPYDLTHAADLLEMTIHEIETLRRHAALDKPTYINAVITDGKTMIGVRYVSDLSYLAASLHYSHGHHFESTDTSNRVVSKGDGDDHTVLIVSEKLNGYRGDWHTVPVNHLLLVGEDGKIVLRKIADVP